MFGQLGSGPKNGSLSQPRVFADAILGIKPLPLVIVVAVQKNCSKKVHISVPQNCRHSKTHVLS